MRTKILAFVSAVAMGAAAAAATPAAAAQYQFNYQSTSGLFGAPPQTLQGVFTTSDTAVDRFGRTAFVITGITGTLNNLAITVNGNKATARFKQDYSADSLNVSSRKTLELVKSGDRWVIVKESTGA